MQLIKNIYRVSSFLSIRSSCELKEIVFLTRVAAYSRFEIKRCWKHVRNNALELKITRSETTVVEQWVRALAPQTEGWVFESQLRQT